MVATAELDALAAGILREHGAGSAPIRDARIFPRLSPGRNHIMEVMTDRGIPRPDRDRGVAPGGP